MDWLSNRPLIVTVYRPGRRPVVSTLTVTLPSPSGPSTAGVAAIGCPSSLTDAVTVSQVCPGTVEVGSANGGPVTPYWPGSGGNTPNPSSTVVPFGVLPGMKPRPVTVTVWPLRTLSEDALIRVSSP